MRVSCRLASALCGHADSRYPLGRLAVFGNTLRPQLQEPTWSQHAALGTCARRASPAANSELASLASGSRAKCDVASRPSRVRPGCVRVMTTSRLLCVSLAKAAGSGRVLAGAGCSVLPARHVCSSPARLQSCMSAWCIDRYGSNEVLRLSEEIPMPTVRSPSDVMIQVCATSLNPLDIAMRGKSQTRTLMKSGVGHTASPCVSSQVVMEPNC